jgi:hypothetical protein
MHAKGVVYFIVKCSWHLAHIISKHNFQRNYCNKDTLFHLASESCAFHIIVGYRCFFALLRKAILYNVNTSWLWVRFFHFLFLLTKWLKEKIYLFSQIKWNSYRIPRQQEPILKKVHTPTCLHDLTRYAPAMWAYIPT